MSDENKVRDAADAVKGIVEAVPVYQDALQPAAREVGVGLQTVAKTIHIALAPISALVWGYEKIKDFVSTSVAKKLEGVPAEQIRMPLPQIAGPILESLKYTGHDESLREMFAKLLATAMNANTATEAHPSFVEIIRQLSSDEAKLCKALKDRGTYPVVNVNAHMADGGIRSYLPLYSRLGYGVGCEFPDMIQRYLGNLRRLGLIDIRFDMELAPDRYVDLEADANLKSFVEKIQREGCIPRIERGVIERTTFGRQFFAACAD